MSSVPVPVLVGPHGTGPRGLFPVSEDGSPDYREDDCQADAEDEEGGWAELLRLRSWVCFWSFLRRAFFDDIPHP